MLLQHIVETLDAELDRLYHLRQIVFEISTPFAIEVDEASIEQVAPAAEKLVIQEAAAAPQSGPAAPVASRKAARKTKAVTERVATPKRRSAGEVTPLKGTIPAGPVVVSAAALKEHAAKRVAPPERRPKPAQETTGSLGSMIRALRLDRTPD